MNKKYACKDTKKKQCKAQIFIFFKINYFYKNQLVTVLFLM